MYSTMLASDVLVDHHLLRRHVIQLVGHLVEFLLDGDDPANPALPEPWQCARQRWLSSRCALKLVVAAHLRVLQRQWHGWWRLVQRQGGCNPLGCSGCPALFGLLVEFLPVLIVILSVVIYFLLLVLLPVPRIVPPALLLELLPVPLIGLLVEFLLVLIVILCAVFFCLLLVLLPVPRLVLLSLLL